MPFVNLSNRAALHCCMLLLPLASVSACSKPAAPVSRYAIHAAAEAGDKEGVQAALDSGISVNAAGRSDATPLHHAAWGNKPDMVRFLASKGAKLDAVDSSDRTPLHYAAQNGFTD